MTKIKRYQVICLLLFAVNLNSLYAEDITGCKIVSARSGSTALESAGKAIDNNPSTKWYNYQTKGAIWLQVQFCNNTTHAVNSYAITSANDRPLRDPKSLTLSGSNDGVDFTLLDSKDNIFFSSRFQTLTFTFTNNTQYKYYRFEFVSHTGNDGVQLSEVKLMKGAGTSTDGQEPAAPSELTTSYVNQESLGLS